MSMPRGMDERIVILDIDEIGRWPWSRNVMAEVVDKRHGVALVAFDVVWAERDTSSGMALLDALAKDELRDSAGFQGAYAKIPRMRAPRCWRRSTCRRSAPR
jgi:adenylate cyclase